MHRPDFYKDVSGNIHPILPEELSSLFPLYVFVFRGRATQKRGRYTDFVPIACLYGFHNESTSVKTAKSGRTVFCFEGSLDA